MTLNEPLAILAGGGPIPALVASAATAAGRKVLILGIEGEADPGIAGFAHETIKWGQFGRVEALLKAHGVREIVLVGWIRRRPDFSSLSLDWLALRSLPKILSIMLGGDDSVLSGAVKFIESRGYKVVGAHEVATDLVASAGCLTRRSPSQKDRLDMAQAARAAIAIGLLDAGQAAVAVSGQIVALEGLEGTDAMLQRVRELHESGRAHWQGRAGVLGKWSKPQQDLRVDMPTIGPGTVQAAAEAGLAGIAIEAGRVMILDRARTVAEADDLGLFLLAQADGQGENPT